MQVVQIQFAVDDPAVADAIVDRLLDARLVACGQRLGPMVSRYRWRGAVEQADEWLVLLKTRAPLADEVVAAVVDLHPYEVPEVLVLPATTTAAYGAWLSDATGATGANEATEGSGD